MPELPSGTVTFLFTDIAGGAALWERNREAMRGAVDRYLTLLDAAIAAHGGVRFKIVGDAAQAAFPTAPAAVAAALDAQLALTAAPWPETGSLRAPMAVHTGEAHPREGDYLAPALNRLSRLLNAGHGGQILLTEAAHQLAHGSLPPQASLKNLGQHRLRDLLEAEEVHQLLHPNLPADFPPLRSLDARPNNLPSLPTLFVGRERELEDIVALLREGGVRLLTLTGPGGTGKTRIALQTAANLLDAFPDGIFFVPLAAVADPALAPSTIASALAIPEIAGLSPRAQVLAELADKTMLLVLDNLEQLPDLAPFVAEMLTTAPGLTVLATSRAPLRVRGEREFPVLPLPLPADGGAVSTEEIAGSDAVRLFVDRAQAVKPHFALGDANAVTVAEIVRRLDGLPLAIELAAARLRLFAPEAMLKRLETRLPLLTGGARDLPERQRALRETIAWSYDLLAPVEQALFRRLAVFAGGMTLEAVEYVGPPEGMVDVLAGLERLAEHSLVQVATDRGGEPRFRMLEKIREFGLERLAAAGEGDATRSRRLGFILDLAGQAALELNGATQGEWLDRLETEHDNFRAALAWAIALPDAAPAVRLAAVLSPFWTTRGHFGEGRAWLERVLARDPAEPKEAVARVLYGAGSIARLQGDADRATELLERSLALRQALGDRNGEAQALMVLGHVSERRGDLAGAAARFEESYAIGREVGDDVLAGAALINLGIVADQQGAYDLAAARYEEALPIFRRRGDRRHESMALENLGNVERARGDLAKSRLLHEASLAISRELGDAWGEAGTLGNLGLVAQQGGDLERARAYYEGSLAGFRDLGDRRGMAVALDNLGHAMRQAGDHPRAAAFHGEALALSRDLDDLIGVAFGLEGIAAVAAAASQTEDALRILSAADALRVTIGAPLPPDLQPHHDRMIASARAILRDDRFATIGAAGAALDWEGAVAEALALAPTIAATPAATGS